MNRRHRVRSGFSLALVSALVAVGGGAAITAASAPVPPAVPFAVLSGAPASAGLSKIKHIVIVMQENRSFDQYFGMYPGADGIPVDAKGNPTVCLNDPSTGQCVYPWHDPSDVQNGGPHGAQDAGADIDKGKMDGFVKEYGAALAKCQARPGSQDCGVSKPFPDVMGYKLRADIPNYWAYADNYVLMDHMFGPAVTWSLPEHLYMMSGWAARCYRQDDPTSCENEINNVDDARYQDNINYAWTDITYLLNKYGVSWDYYLFNGTEPDCTNPSDLTCVPLPQSQATGSIWNPLPNFTDVKQSGSLSNIQSVDNFAAAAQNGTLPSVSWVVPTNPVSEHPPAGVNDGEKYVTYMVNQVMQGPDWDSTAIFLAWDDWGGFYDNVVPPKVDANGLGIRVPSLLISPYAKQGYVDHGVHSFDSYLKLIEDVFMGSARLDPTTDGRPDPRPTVRENAPQLSDLAADFDFTQSPRPPTLLPTVAPGQLAAPVVPKAAPTPKTATKTASARAAAPPAGGPLSGTAPYNVVFDGSASSAGTAPIKRWTLTFGDGGKVTGKGAPPSAISHTYATAGDDTARLLVVDKTNATATDTVQVTVGPAPPHAWIEGNQPLGFDSDAEHFDGSQSTPGNWTIDFGDGSNAVTGTGVPPKSVAHTYTTPGTYTTALTVIDPTSGLSDVARAITVVSASRAPTVVTRRAEPGWHDRAAHRRDLAQRETVDVSLRVGHDADQPRQQHARESRTEEDERPRGDRQGPHTRRAVLLPRRRDEQRRDDRRQHRLVHHPDRATGLSRPADERRTHDRHAERERQPVELGDERALRVGHERRDRQLDARRPAAGEPQAAGVGRTQRARAVDDLLVVPGRDERRGHDGVGGRHVHDAGGAVERGVAHVLITTCRAARGLSVRVSPPESSAGRARPGCPRGRPR